MIRLRFWMTTLTHCWWWKVLHILNQLLLVQIMSKQKLFWFKTRYKTGLKLKEVGCICSQSFHQKTFNKKCLSKNKNLIKLINIGNWPYNISQNKKIFGTILILKNIKLNLKIAINYSMKFKKVCQNILKLKEDFSQDFISYLINNY